MLLTETAAVALSGELGVGPFPPLALSREKSMTFSEGPPCGVKKAAKRGTFSGSTVSFK
jgi:hypothetical protein